MADDTLRQEPVRDWNKVMGGTLRDYPSWLDDSGVMPSDLDFILHVGGPEGDEFLVMEFKEPGAKLPDGQRYLLRALSKQRNFTVVTVWGPKEDGTYYLSTGQTVKQKTLRDMVVEWAETSKGMVGR